MQYNADSGPHYIVYTATHVLVSPGIITITLTCLSIATADLSNKEKKNKNKHLSARLFLNTWPDSFCLPAVKPREEAKRSRAAPQLTRCADSLYLVRSVQTRLKGKVRVAAGGEAGFYNQMIRSMSSTADSCDQQVRRHLGS